VIILLTRNKSNQREKETPRKITLQKNITKKVFIHSMVRKIFQIKYPSRFFLMKDTFYVSPIHVETWTSKG